MKHIVFFGNSLTSGYGLMEPSKDSFPALIQKKLMVKKLDYRVINAGKSGDTTQSALERIQEVLDLTMDIFVLELGANDLLRGFSARVTKNNLQAIIRLVKNRHPDVRLLLLGMQLPEWVPGERAATFRNVYSELADENGMELVPFLLDGVAGIKHLNMYDGVHPLAAGYEIVAENVWPVLFKMITADQQQAI